MPIISLQDVAKELFWFYYLVSGWIAWRMYMLFHGAEGWIYISPTADQLEVIQDEALKEDAKRAKKPTRN